MNGFGNKNIVHVYNLDISLEELYTGCIKKLSVPQTKICVSCNGSGMRQQLSQMGGLFIQQFVSCPTCKSTGKITSDIFDEVALDVVPGTVTDGKPIRFKAGNGDVDVLLHQTPHPIFTRVGHDLHITLEITLGEALCGMNKVVTTLDGRRIVLSTIENEIIRPKLCGRIVGEGMKYEHGNGYAYGDLILNFNILFPQLNPAEINQLKPILNVTFPLKDLDDDKIETDIKENVECKDNKDCNKRVVLF